jgi:hypothetical protein
MVIMDMPKPMSK